MRNCAICVVILIAAVSAWAQRISGELRLRVTDFTGAALHATGTIVGQRTGIDRVFETDEQGKSVIRGLPPGRYELMVRSNGFAEKILTVEIASELPMEERVTLEVT